MRGMQAVLAGVILLGGIGMLVSMPEIGWVNKKVGLISAAVVVASFALMAYSDMRSAAKPGEHQRPPDDARPPM